MNVWCCETNFYKWNFIIRKYNRNKQSYIDKNIRYLTLNCFGLHGMDMVHSFLFLSVFHSAHDDDDGYAFI